MMRMEKIYTANFSSFHLLIYLREHVLYSMRYIRFNLISYNRTYNLYLTRYEVYKINKNYKSKGKWGQVTGGEFLSYKDAGKFEREKKL